MVVANEARLRNRLRYIVYLPRGCWLCDRYDGNGGADGERSEGEGGDDGEDGTLGEFGTIGRGTFGFLASTDSAPFVLSLFGTSRPNGTYSADITVTAVPEPETYGMMVGGLALLGFMARRRKAKNAA